VAHDLSRPDPPRRGDGDPPRSPEPVARGVNMPWWNWLLLVPLVGVLFPAIYNKKEPTLFDIPFFYWYQTAWIFGSVLITFVVYRATRGER